MRPRLNGSNGFSSSMHFRWICLHRLQVVLSGKSLDLVLVEYYVWFDMVGWDMDIKMCLVLDSGYRSGIEAARFGRRNCSEKCSTEEADGCLTRHAQRHGDVGELR